MSIKVNKLPGLLMLLAIPLFMTACDEDDEEKRNPTCPSAYGLQKESQNLTDSAGPEARISYRGITLSIVNTGDRS